ncbi:PAS domain S-box protein [Sphingobium nicotianae]|uniref:histidine kinase n=1 Tax=Sphingobium nicotianae TaxID=2782607 RepID=A0A9X1D9G1_9SPHN|nr:PAS domain S-box protein [Sphingobium nicotianae]MBT2185631.1 PAS domain S-box protein [Sphingobium nicotianae]
MTQFDHDHGRGDGSRNDGPFITGSNALLAAIVQCANDAIIGMDLHGTVLSWNDAATRLLGHGAADMIGRPISRIIPYDRRREQEALLSSIRDGSGTAMFETIHLGASGHEIAVTVTPSPVLDHAGAIIAASIIVRERGAARRDARANWPYMLAAPSLVKRNILVVEDEALIGLGLAAMLENSGFDVIGPAGDVKTAMALLDRHDCALAILDINLGRGETSAPLAERLKQDGVPFFVTSGYLSDSQPAIFGEVPNFPKPIRVRSLVAAVQEVLG